MLYIFLHHKAVYMYISWSLLSFFIFSCGKSEKNSSVCKYILKASLKNFLKNPTEESLEVLKANCQIMDPEDEEAFNYFLENKNTYLPKTFRTEFFKVAWKVFERADQKLKDKKYELLYNIPKEIISGLEENFCVEILTNQLFEPKQQNINYQLENFTRKFVSCAENEDVICNKLNAIFKIIKDKCDQISNKRFSSIKQSVYNLIKWLCQESIEIKSAAIASLLFLKIQSLGALEDVYNETLLVEFTKNYLDFKKEESWQFLAKSIFNTFNNMSVNNQFGLFPIFNSVLNDLFGMVPESIDGKDFLAAVSENIDSSINALLLLECIPKCFTRSNENFDFYNEILDKISNSRDPVVRLRYKHAITSEFCIREKQNTVYG